MFFKNLDKIKNPHEYHRDFTTKERDKLKV